MRPPVSVRTATARRRAPDRAPGRAALRPRLPLLLLRRGALRLLLQRRLPSLAVRRAAPSGRHYNLARRLGTARMAPAVARPRLPPFMPVPLLLETGVSLFAPALPYRPTLITWGRPLLLLTSFIRLSPSWSLLLTSLRPSGALKRILPLGSRLSVLGMLPFPPRLGCVLFQLLR